MTHYRDMTPEQRAAAQAEVDAYQAAKPAAIEEDAPAIFSPGIICFVDGEYRAVSSDIETPWPWIKPHMESLLSLLPMRHRLDYWHDRIQRGAAAAGHSRSCRL